MHDESEDDVVEAVNTWLKHKPTIEQQKYEDKLMPLVQLKHCSRQKLEALSTHKSCVPSVGFPILEFLVQGRADDVEKRINLEDRILIMAGNKEDNIGNACFMYLDSEFEDASTTEASMFIDSELYSICHENGNIYVSGGYTVRTTKMSMQGVQRYQVRSNKWKTCRSTTSSGKHCSVCLDGKLIVLGGQREEHDEVKYEYSSVEMLDVTTKVWSDLRAMPISLTNYCVALVDQHVIAIGGDSQGKVSFKVIKYSIQHDEWKYCAPIPQNNQFSLNSIVTIDTNVYVLAYEDFLVYNTDLDSWMILTPPPEPSFCCAMVLYEGQLMVLGGFQKTGKRPNYKIQLYNLTSGSWSEGETRMPKALHSHSAYVVQIPKNQIV